jgi:hypothetical protein
MEYRYTSLKFIFFILNRYISTKPNLLEGIILPDEESCSPSIKLEPYTKLNDNKWGEK